MQSIAASDSSMQRRAFGVAAVALCALLTACTQQPSPQASLANHWDLLDRYCSDCHNDAEYSGELSFDTLQPASVAEVPETFEKVVRKLRGDLMPPPGQPRPQSDAIAAFAESLENTLDTAAARRGPMPGNVPLHRLNRTEYAAAVEQLLGLRIDARDMLPADVSSDGFDNVAAVLGVSPTHLDQYIAAARDISIMALGEHAPDLARADYRTERGNRSAHVDGLPLGTRGGLLVEHNFPSDGTYAINVAITSIPGSELRGYPYGWLEYQHRLVVVVDGKKVFEDTIGGAEDSRALDQRQIAGVDEIRSRFQDIRIPIEAGVREVGAAFVARSHAEGDYLLDALVPGEGVPDIPRLFGFEVIGPFDPSGIGGSTESRARVFSCYPETTAEESPCAREILSRLAERAFRRPVDPAELEPVFAFYESGRAAGGFESGIQKGLMAILASTKFVYRAEPADSSAPGAPGENYSVTDLELAWRLAFFLWSQGPDEALLARVDDGTLSDRDVFADQVRRMLSDPRSEALVTNFAYQWLGVRRLDAIDPDPRLYPSFDEDLRAAFRTEMRLYLDSILRADRSVVDLLDAGHTFVNERLARHYGIPDVRGDRFRRIELEDTARHGLFGKGSVLLVTSYPDRTSPVLRGAWIMEHLLAAPPNPPPPEVETDLAPVVGDIPRSVRERLALHRELPSCNQCHGVIDPLGQALEHFDAVGEWREKERDSGVAIDSTG
ncbi:MAG TPA: DUF1592 domain-containing protein, partial [Gammaproteobacteria bacterium]|nr:DUF1592 domain-containing protein [Gammaproteobacteria bacterium]